MICAGVSDILYPGGTFGENSCIVCTHLSLLYAPAVTLHLTQIMFTLIIFIDTFDSCHCRGSSIFWWEFKQRSKVVGFGEIYPISALDLTLHRIVVGANYQRILVLIVFIFAKRLFFMILFETACFRYLSISCSSYDPSGITIFLSSLSK